MKTLEHGRYQLLDRLGAGGAAHVWRAKDTQRDALCALKILEYQGRALSERQRHRLTAEVRAMTRLRHPHILKVERLVQSDGYTFVVMELAECGTLNDKIQQDGKLNEKVAVRYMTQVAQALAAAHAEGIVHRDVKPQNILLHRDDRALLADFGIAMIVDDPERRTLQGTTLGSLAFCAPEQRRDARSVGPTTDIYAVGTTLYHLVTGGNPTDLDQANADSPRFLGLDPALVDVIVRATRRNPEDRYPTAKALEAALRVANTASPAPKRSLRAPPPGQATAPIPIPRHKQQTRGEPPRNGPALGYIAGGVVLLALLIWGWATL